MPPRDTPPLRLFRSTPPRRGDGPPSACWSSRHVSIHAPAKGRPSAPPLRETPKCFDPRPREGATAADRRDAVGLGVSIHAPAKGRRLATPDSAATMAFRSTPPRRGDYWFCRHRHYARKFRSTPPRRGDVTVPSASTASTRFRSTPPRRGDVTLEGIRPACRSFDPRPREGATRFRRLLQLELRVVSIHAPAKGRP